MQWGEHCALSLSTTVKYLGIRPFKTAVDQSIPFAVSQGLNATDDVCAHAVCFRPSQVAQVTITLGLTSDSVQKTER